MSSLMRYLQTRNSQRIVEKDVTAILYLSVLQGTFTVGPEGREVDLPEVRGSRLYYPDSSVQRSDS